MQKTNELIEQVESLVGADLPSDPLSDPKAQVLSERAGKLAKYAIEETKGELRDLLLEISKNAADLALYWNDPD